MRKTTAYQLHLAEALKYDIQIVEPDEVKPVEDPQQIAQGSGDPSVKTVTS